MATPRKTPTTAKPTTAETAPAAAKPQDRKVSLPEQVEGWELFIAPKKVKASDKFRLMGAMKKLRIHEKEEGESFEPDPEAFADFIDFVGDKFAKDSDKFVEWTMGERGAERTMNLVMTYSNALGE